MTEEENGVTSWGVLFALGEIAKSVIAAVFGGCLTLCFLGPIALGLGVSAVYWLLKLFRVL